MTARARNSAPAWLGAAAGLVGWAGAVACWVDSDWPVLDLAAQAAPVWLAGGVAGVLLGWQSRRRGGGLALMLGVVSSLLLLARMAPEWSARAPDEGDPSAAATPLRLVQYNTWFRNPDPAGSAAAILAAKPDVVVLEEVSAHGNSIVSRLRPTLPYAIGPGYRAQIGGVVIMSRRPIRQGPTPRERPSAMLVQGYTTAPDGGALTVAGAHFDWPEPLGLQGRQHETFLRWLGATPRPDGILAGDFNATPWSRSLRKLDVALASGPDLRRITHGQLTWPARMAQTGPLPVPVLAIDQVYAGRAWRTLEVRRLGRTSSDHYPVLVVLQRR